MTAVRRMDSPLHFFRWNQDPPGVATTIAEQTATIPIFTMARLTATCSFARTGTGRQVIATVVAYLSLAASNGS
jgi:hypothetical protein